MRKFIGTVRFSSTINGEDVEVFATGECSVEGPSENSRGGEEVWVRTLKAAVDPTGESVAIPFSEMRRLESEAYPHFIEAVYDQHENEEEERSRHNVAWY